MDRHPVQNPEAEDRPTQSTRLQPSHEKKHPVALQQSRRRLPDGLTGLQRSPADTRRSPLSVFQAPGAAVPPANATGRAHQARPLAGPSELPVASHSMLPYNDAPPHRASLDTPTQKKSLETRQVDRRFWPRHEALETPRA